MSEYTEIGMIFAGIGMILFYGIFTWTIYQLMRPTKNRNDTRVLQETYEQATIHEVAKNNGFNLRKLLAEKNIYEGKKFKEKLEEEILKEAFKEKEKKK